MTSKLESAVVTRAIALVAAAVVLNIGLGWLVQYVLDWPLYLDSVGSILAGALLGPVAGAATGALSNTIWALWLGEPAKLPYAITAAFVGWAAGYAALRGAFERLQTVLLAGFLTGIGAALVSAPITAYVHGGVTGAGTDYLTAVLSATGANLLQAATIQSFLSDPLDKTISFGLAWLMWRVLRLRFAPLSERGVRPLEALSGYSLAVALSLLSVLVCLLFLPAFGRSIFSVFYLAVVLSAWRGGLGPALVTTVVGALAGMLLLVTPFHYVGITIEDWLRVGIFVAVSLAIAAIANRLEQSRLALHVALEAERQGWARLRAVTDSVAEVLLVVSPEQRVIGVNRRGEELLGLPADRLVGQQLADIRSVFDQEFADADELYALVLASSADPLEERSQLVAQIWPQARELQLYSTPVADQDGFMGRLFVLRDVTHEREVERLKSEFVSLVSHELRTPLTAIKGFTELVLDGDAGEVNNEVVEYLGIVHGNVERLMALVNDLLDLSRIESGRIELKSEPVDLNEVVRVVVDTMGQPVAQKKQSLEASVDAGATGVVGDRDKLVQVLTNYVSNAHKYTQEGGAIRVEVRRDDGFARVAVSDNGHGIAPEDQERLFTRFYRVDSDLTRTVGGTGLGLSIVKQLIELQGGEVGVQSAPGEGSTFFFTVPLAAQDPSPLLDESVER